MNTRRVGCVTPGKSRSHAGAPKQPFDEAAACATASMRRINKELAHVERGVHPFCEVRTESFLAKCPERDPRPNRTALQVACDMEDRFRPA